MVGATQKTQGESSVFTLYTTPAPDPGIPDAIIPVPDSGTPFPTTMDIAIIAAVITAVALVLLCLLLVVLRYLFRHKGTYHTNEAKGTEFAESADMALQSDPALQDAGDHSKKEYFI
ncbi:glycophorin-C isoform X3 [Heterocephalus glaber]|nr:glycophorin-C isoform X3 [Heterocephalus glaber]